MKGGVKKSTKRMKCDTWRSSSLCKSDEHCMWVMPGGPCVSRSDYKRKGVKLGLRESKPKFVPVRKPVGKGRCGELRLVDLKKMATKAQIPGRSKMNKVQLCRALGL